MLLDVTDEKVSAHSWRRVTGNSSGPEEIPVALRLWGTRSSGTPLGNFSLPFTLLDF